MLTSNRRPTGSQLDLAIHTSFKNPESGVLGSPSNAAETASTDMVNTDPAFTASTSEANAPMAKLIRVGQFAARKAFLFI
jgi:hypothetical protein